MKNRGDFQPLGVMSVYADNIMIEAAKSGDVEAIRAYLTAGAELNARDGEGMSALTWAARRGQKKVVRVLLDKGLTDIDLKDSYGFTPLFWAARRGYVDIVRILLENGADPGTKDIYGWTPMTWAVQRGHFKIMKLLRNNHRKNGRSRKGR
jgi:ankyrin repeat protein